jgi:DNA-binding GntR family transcriptional regulator
MEASVDDPKVESLQDFSRSSHEGIVAISGHERLISLYSSLSIQIAMLDRLVAPRSSKPREVEWHRPLVVALMGDDAVVAEQVMREHIRESYESYLEAFVAQQPEDDSAQQISGWM